MTDSDGFAKGGAAEMGEWRLPVYIVEVKLPVLAIGLDVGGVGKREILCSS